MKITYLDTETKPVEETVIYWFRVDGLILGIADNNGVLSLLGVEGTPVNVAQHSADVMTALLPHYKHRRHE